MSRTVSCPICGKTTSVSDPDGVSTFCVGTPIDPHNRKKMYPL